MTVPSVRLMFAKIAGLFMLESHPANNSSRPLKNVFEAADARQEQAKKRSLCMINEHFESVFNVKETTKQAQVILAS